MNYCGLYRSDSINGEGWRTVLFLSGCNIKCKNCQNAKAQNPNYGKKFTNKVLDDIISELKKPYISGLTLSGGDPLYPANRKEVLELVKTVKEKVPDKTIWLYTGYKYENVKKLEIMKFIDVIVDGPYIEEKRGPKLPFRGSSNQRIIALNSYK